MSSTNRIRQVTNHLVAAIEAEAEEKGIHIDEYIARNGHTRNNQSHGSEQAEFTQRLKEMPRVSKDIATWTNAELMRRGLALGASDDQVSDILASTDSRAELLALVSSLEPPPPASATVEQITVDVHTTTVEKMSEILERVGAVVITNAASQELMDAIDVQLEEAGAWNISRGKQVGGRPAGRMQMDMLIKAPLTEKLVTNDYVTGVARHVLGPHCKRIALKELSGEYTEFSIHIPVLSDAMPTNTTHTYTMHVSIRGSTRQLYAEVSPRGPVLAGNATFPLTGSETQCCGCRADLLSVRPCTRLQWHHEPVAWSTNMLWAIDDFTAENGGTNVVPYSHRSTMYMRENGRELLDGNFDPNECASCSLCHAVR
jgi:hypothetical protein